MSKQAEKAGARSQRPVNVPGYTKHFTSKTHEHKWYVVDAAGKSVGRLATEVATLLRGKHKPTFTQHEDVGDFVVVINAAQAQFRGNDKVQKKKYYRHTGYFGHLYSRTAEQMLANKPETVLRHAIKGMLNSGRLCNRTIKKLKIYRGAEHPHKAQNPEIYQVKER